MIGVLSKEDQAQTVEEFFQLFKTPWEFWAPGRNYDLILAAGPELPDDCGLTPLVIYQADPTRFDLQNGLEPHFLGASQRLRWRDAEFPVYGKVLAFRSSGRSLIETKESSAVVACAPIKTENPTIRIGYDLFAEISFLLTQGQPAQNASVATLEVHIEILREILTDLQIPFIEVLPAPHLYQFMCCLTHDVDFVGIRDHRFDHTMWGFLLRSLVGSFRKALGGRLPWSKCFRNWAAALSLPLVHLRLKDDFWLEFDRYAEIEKAYGSTFFFIPFKDVPGKLGAAKAPKRRAAKYDLRNVREHIRGLVEKGCEVGLHGIDAWHDVEHARAERARICDVADRNELGTRMHWLYWSDASPKTLEAAGFQYDSTFGYNDAVGFRAGTAQPYCPLNAEHLLELPLVIQDSALFYPDRLGLSEPDALELCQKVVRAISSTGGALTVNWHTRSLSPERLWDDFYRQLLSEIRSHRVWFGTASDVVAWFHARRELRFESVQFQESGLRVIVSSNHNEIAPPFSIRAHQPNAYESPENPRFTDYQLPDDGVLDTNRSVAAI